VTVYRRGAAIDEERVTLLRIVVLAKLLGKDLGALDAQPARPPRCRGGILAGFIRMRDNGVFVSNFYHGVAIVVHERLPVLFARVVEGLDVFYTVRITGRHQSNKNDVPHPKETLMAEPSDTVAGLDRTVLGEGMDPEVGPFGVAEDTSAMAMGQQRQLRMDKKVGDGRERRGRTR